MLAIAADAVRFALLNFSHGLTVNKNRLSCGTGFLWWHSSWLLESECLNWLSSHRGMASGYTAKVTAKNPCSNRYLSSQSSPMTANSAVFGEELLTSRLMLIRF